MVNLAVSSHVGPMQGEYHVLPMLDSPRVILAEPIEPAPLAWLRGQVDLVETAPGEPGFEEAMAEAEGLVVRTGTRVDESMLQMAPRLRVVARAGVGLDTINLEACRARGITVLNTPDGNTQAVVEFTITVLADALRPRNPIEGPVDDAAWSEMRSGEHAKEQMDQLTLGILGMGRIGRRVAEVAGAIGFEVIYTDLEDLPIAHRHGAVPVSLEELLRRSNVLTVHVDGRESNRHFLDASRLALRPVDGLLINTSRGFVIEETALAEHLVRCPHSRAILDVHEREPVPHDCPLLGLSNVTLYPHIASRTRTGLENMGWVVRDLVDHLLSPAHLPDG